MNNSNLLANLTIKELYALAAGNCDEQELAQRIVNHARLAVSKARGWKVDSTELLTLGDVIEKDLASRAAPIEVIDVPVKLTDEEVYGKLETRTATGEWRSVCDNDGHVY